MVLPAIRVVGTGDAELVERLGKYNRQLQPGFHLLLPLFEQVSYRCTTREQVLDIQPQPAITNDNAPLSIDAVVYWRVVDPERARYAVAGLKSAIENLVITQLRSEIGRLTLDETFTARQRINTALLELTKAATAAWGVEVTRVEVQSITPKGDILKAMEMQMSAERNKRAVVLNSEGERQSQVNKAQGEADAVRLEAEAAADSIKLRAEAEARRLETEAEGLAKALETIKASAGGDDGGTSAALQVMMLTKYLETQGALASSPNAKTLFFPSKASVPLTFEGLREIIQE